MKTNALPVLETIYKSIAWPWYYRKRLALALLPMFLAMLCLELATSFIPGIPKENQALIFAFVAWPLNILYVITTHRFMILGPDATPKFGMFEWRAREWNFLLYTLWLGFLLGAMGGVALMILFGIGDVSSEDLRFRMIAFIAYLPAFLVFARLSLVFPATAVDSDSSLSKAWKAGQGNTIRLALVVYAVPAVTSAFGYLFPDWIYQNFEAILTVLGILIGYIMWVIEIACLSFAYKYLIALPEENAS